MEFSDPATTALRPNIARITQLAIEAIGPKTFKSLQSSAVSLCLVSDTTVPLLIVISGRLNRESTNEEGLLTLMTRT